MFDLTAFFRRNQKIFWLLIAAFMATFVSIQLSKSWISTDSNYGEIAECSYTLQAPQLQTPLNRQEYKGKYCSIQG